MKLRTNQDLRLARTCSGSLLVETLIAITLFSVVLLSSMAMVQSGRRFSNSTLQITTVEDLAQQMLFRLESELASASGERALTTLTGVLAAGEVNTLQVSATNLGFPPRGTLVLERGRPQEERIAYRGIADANHFRDLVRGEQCTNAQDHQVDSTLDILWAGLAEPLENQIDPAASDYDGISLEEGQQVYFRGDGIGFSYRVPVDPSGGNNPVVGHQLNFGAEVPGVGATLSGWVAVVFEASDSYDESATHDDLNRDGDSDDVFDVGQIRRLTWDTSDPNRIEDLGLGPTNVIQERCNWGGDLDADGFADPLFLWNHETNLLHVRLFVLGRAAQDMPVVRKVESVMFLRNEPEL